MQLRQATRQKAKIRLGLSAVSGGGKTYSALLIAFGLTGDWSKIGVVDSENGSADLYAHLGAYNVITLGAPFSPEKYIQAIEACEEAGMQVIIIDSITHEWEFVLQEHGSMNGNSFTNWAKFTPRHDAFVKKILASSAHVITTVRRKQDYEIVKDSNGKALPQKIGLKEITRDGFEYEVTLNFEIDTAHQVNVSKDRTGLFAGKPSFIPSAETGKILKQWCDSGAEPIKEIDPRPLVDHTHPKWDVIKDAVWNKGYTIEQYEAQVRFTEEAKQYLRNKPQPVTQAMISEANSNYTAPVQQPSLNGQAAKPKPF